VEITVNGKRVVLRDKIEAKRGWNVVVMKSDVFTRGLAGLTFEDVAALGTVAIASWEFDGDPAIVESYAELDLVTEFIPLTKELGNWLGAKFNPPKN